MHNKKFGFVLPDTTCIDTPPRCAKRGFTLSEVLITLGIIGVVAAITIPTLMTKIQEKQTVSKLRATQAIFAQALKTAEEEEGDPTCWGLIPEVSGTQAIIIANKLKPYLKIAVDCGLLDNNEKCLKNTNYKLLDGAETINYVIDTRYYKISLLNGTTAWWRGASPGEPFIFQIFIDTNGKNSPNMWGKDLFVMNYTSERGLYPLGSPSDGRNDYVFDKNGCFGQSPTGYGCAYYVLQTGSMSYLHKK